MKTGVAICLGLGLGLLAQQNSLAIPVFTDRTIWEHASSDVFWDVDLAGKPNGLVAGTTLAKGSGIALPPFFEDKLSFDTDLSVLEGKGWRNYIDPKGGDPLVLGTGKQLQITGTFTEGERSFGFEILPYVSSTITVTLSDGTSISKLVDAAGSPQFFGWVMPENDRGSVTSFTIQSSASGFNVGNFAVPDKGATLALLGLAFCVLAGVRSRNTPPAKKATKKVPAASGRETEG